MGSLVRKKKSGILLTVVTAILLIGLISPPALAGANLEQHKIQMLQTMGLDGTDPVVIRAAQEASTLYAVDVASSDGQDLVVLRFSSMPTYGSSLYKKDHMLVLDLRNTINLSASPVSALGDEDPIIKVRNSQFRVSPTFMSRVVVELRGDVTPEIHSEGNNLIVSVPLPSPTPVAESETQETSEKTKEASSRVVSVPAVNVNTDTPKVDYMFAEAAAEPAPEAAEAAAEPAPEVSEVVSPPAPEVAEITAEPAPEVAEVATQPEPEIAEVAASKSAPTDEEVKKQPNEMAAKPDKSGACEHLAAVASLLREPEAEASPTKPLPVAAPQPEINEPAMKVAALSEEPAVEPTPVAAPPAPPQAEPVVTVEKEAAPVEQDAAPAVEPAATEPGNAEQEEQTKENPVAAEPEPAMPESKASENSRLSSRIEVKPVEDTASPDGELVSLNFRDADLGAVLDILARKGNFNILAGKDVRGSVTVRLTDVPLNVALNAILNVNGYGYIKMNNIIRILPLSQLGKEVVTTTDTFLLSYANAQKAKTTLTPFLTTNGTIQTDERTNMLIVTDVPNNMDRIRALIPQIDTRVQQVLIEVLILDSVLSDSTDLGIQWSLFDRNANTLVDQVPSPISTKQSGFKVNLPVTANALNLSFGALMGDFKLDAFIQSTVDNTRSRILANPKILTLNNESAHIEIVEEFPYSDVTQTSSGGQLSNITFKEIGTKLEVKPQITHDGHVILKIIPEQNFPADVTATGVPIVDTRRAETTLIVKDNQTIVLGGLRLNRKIKSVIKVPLLGDLPAIKYAFRSVESDDSDTELLVFITVHIVESPPLLADQKIKFNELANLPRTPGTSIDVVR